MANRQVIQIVTLGCFISRLVIQICQITSHTSTIQKPFYQWLAGSTYTCLLAMYAVRKQSLSYNEISIEIHMWDVSSSTKTRQLEG